MITSRNNREIIEAAKLRKKKIREERRQFLIDGTKLLKEAVENDITISKVYATKDWISKGPVDLESLEVEEVSEPVIEKLSGVKTSEGVIAIAEIPEFILDEGENRLVILENIQDPGNLGTIIRTADAFNYKNIIISENCVDIFNEKTLRASMGSLFHVNVLKQIDIIKYIDDLKENSYSIIGTSLDGSDLNIKDLNIPNKVAIILGNESNGISQEVQDRCTLLQKIPITGRAESLNVSIAAGIFLYLYAQ